MKAVIKSMSSQEIAARFSLQICIEEIRCSSNNNQTSEVKIQE